VIVPVFCLTVFLALTTSVFAGGPLDALVKAAEGFAAAIQQQIAAVQSITSTSEFVAKTIVYSETKTAYFNYVQQNGSLPQIPPFGRSNGTGIDDYERG
jgi:hypothetical protein